MQQNWQYMCFDTACKVSYVSSNLTQGGVWDVHGGRARGQSLPSIHPRFKPGPKPISIPTTAVAKLPAAHTISTVNAGLV